jgi:hypothetical protein
MNPATELCQADDVPVVLGKLCVEFPKLIVIGLVCRKRNEAERFEPTCQLAV